jgi:phytoene desaturase
VIESFLRIAEKKGVRFCFDTPVEAIEVSGGSATGVRLANGEHLRADIVIANADLPYVYRCLLPDKAPRRQIERLQYTCSTLTYYWAMDKTYDAIDMHNVFLAGDYRQSFDRIFHDLTLPDEPSFYVHAPTRVDPSAAPPGRDTLMVLVPVGRISDDGKQDEAGRQDWGALKDRARRWVLDCLAKAGAPDLEEHITHEVVYTPHTWQRLCNLEKGSAFGLSHNFMQVGYLRPHNRHPRYANLYFCGSSTHPGTGLPMVLLSARLVAERIAHEWGG